jgi:hypothetical protein
MSNEKKITKILKVENKIIFITGVLMQMNFKDLMIYLFAIFLILTLVSKYNNMQLVKAQAQGPVTQTTANVSISGWLDDINVSCIPINFNATKTVYSDSQSYEKDSECGNANYIMIDPGPSTNEKWNLYMNATDLTDGQGHWINISYPGYDAILQVNATCGDQSQTPYITLSYDITPICSLVAEQFEPLGIANVSINITIPAGVYNATYTGDFCVYINKTNGPNVNIKSWCGNTFLGFDQINVTISPTLDIAKSLEPIMFGEQRPQLEPYDALEGQGFPMNITSGLKTNIFIDLYINGTDLDRSLGPLAGYEDTITSYNVTYSNATAPSRIRIGDNTPAVWPPKDTNLLEHNLPDNPTDGDRVIWGGGDFLDWHMVSNDTHIYSYWNMTVPIDMSLALAPGVYDGDITAKIVDAGRDPTP